MGLFAGADYAACVKIVAAWFGFSERGRALGLFDWHPLYWGLGCLTAVVALVCLFSLADSPTREGQRANDAGPAAPRPRASKLFGDRNLVLIAVAGFGANWGSWGFAFWATALMIRGYQLSAVDAGLVAVIFGAAAAVSKPLFGLLSDLLGGKRRNLRDLGSVGLFGHADAVRPDGPADRFHSCGAVPGLDGCRL